MYSKDSFIDLPVFALVIKYFTLNLFATYSIYSILIYFLFSISHLLPIIIIMTSSLANY